VQLMVFRALSCMPVCNAVEAGLVSPKDTEKYQHLQRLSLMKRSGIKLPACLPCYGPRQAGRRTGRQPTEGSSAKLIGYIAWCTQFYFFFMQVIIILVSVQENAFT
jgi:hypothetical protein